MKYAIGLSLLFTSLSFGATAGPFYPTVCVSDGSGPAGNIWNNVDNAEGACDTSVADVTLSGDVSENLNCSSFGFDSLIGPLDRINGVTVTWRKKRAGLPTHTVVDENVQLTNGLGGQFGTDKADGITDWGTSLADVTYGSATDTWGAASTLTGALVRSSAFGVVIAGYNDGVPTSSAQVDCVAVTIDYTPIRTTIIDGKIF